MTSIIITITIMTRGDKMTTGQRIIELRKNAGYTRTDFANKLGIPYTTLRNYENDEREPGHNFLIAVAKELNVSIDYLLGISEDKQSNSNYKIDLSSSEQAHIIKYRQLNADGQNKVDEYTTDLVDSGKYASKENINTEDKATSVTDFKPAKKGKVLHGRAVAFGGATLKTEIDEDTAREIAELRKKLDEKQNNN